MTDGFGGTKTRRTVLVTIVASGPAGCLGLAPTNRDGEDSTDRPRTRRHLRGATLYLGPDFDRALPASTARGDDPACARLAVLNRETSVAGSTVVGWLRDGVPVAVVGSAATDRLFELLEEGDAFDHFGGEVVVDRSGGYDVAAVEPVDDDRLATHQSDGDPVAALDDVVGGVANDGDRPADCGATDEAG